MTDDGLLTKNTSMRVALATAKRCGFEIVLVRRTDEVRIYSPDRSNSMRMQITRKDAGKRFVSAINQVLKARRMRETEGEPA